MGADFTNFACDSCGACCKSLIVEAMEYDCKREPKLYEIGGIKPEDRHAFSERGGCVVLYDTEKHQCPFLVDNRCSIYPTRPVVCVMVDAGDAKCQQSRHMQGLPALMDKDGNPATLEMMCESVEDYNLNLLDICNVDDETEVEAWLKNESVSNG